jgi:putative PIN family toxin of toxin-antitoxin system
VLVSAALARSPTAPSLLTLDAALDGRLELITSRLLPREVARVLARPRLRKYLSTDEALTFATDLAGQTTLLTDPPPPHPTVCRDPHDYYLVALATASHADAIMPGDDEQDQKTPPFWLAIVGVGTRRPSSCCPWATQLVGIDAFRGPSVCRRPAVTGANGGATTSRAQGLGWPALTRPSVPRTG